MSRAFGPLLSNPQPVSIIATKGLNTEAVAEEVDTGIQVMCLLAGWAIDEVAGTRQ